MARVKGSKVAKVVFRPIQLQLADARTSVSRVMTSRENQLENLDNAIENLTAIRDLVVGGQEINRPVRG